MVSNIQSYREDGRPRAQDVAVVGCWRGRSLPPNDHCISVCSRTPCTRANTIISSSSSSSVILASERSGCHTWFFYNSSSLTHGSVLLAPSICRWHLYRELHKHHWCWFQDSDYRIGRKDGETPNCAWSFIDPWLCHEARESQWGWSYRRLVPTLFWYIRTLLTLHFLTSIVGYSW